ncbi:MAG: GAF domain-containing protein [Acidobacteria bacterium]|jgi:sigma-B regulation protein RsbU (phosphoserine phosphatase)|nr:GAF domain-containing protein [Acidobacteriota bacterium]
MAKKTADKTIDKKKRDKKLSSVADSSFDAQLRDAIRAVDVANLMTSPLRRSIENILRVAGDALGSDEASVLVRDGNRGGLKFLVAIGEVADKLMKVRIPPGKGIAGFVFASGQPVAVADVAQEETFYAEVDRATGYSTQTILATPLRVEDETVGVLEFVNRLGNPPYQPFTPEEMDKAAHFADAIATLVDAHETAGLVETLFERSVKASDKAETKSSERKNSDLLKWLKGVRSAPEHRDLLLLAVQLRDIAGRGDAERALCRDVLEALDRFTGKKSASGAGYFGF